MALAHIGIKLNTELIVGDAVLLEGNVKEKLPELEVLLVALLKLGKLCSRLVIKARVLFCFLVELDVKLNKAVASAVCYLFGIAPSAVSNYHLTELSTPVAEVVYTNALEARKLVQKAKRMTDNSGTEVADVEGLCNVGGGVVKNYCLAVAVSGRAVAITLFGNVAHNVSNESGAVNAEVKVSACNGAFRNIITGKALSKLCGDNGRTHS